MSPSLIRPILTFAALAAVAGCATDTGFTPPPLPSSVSGSGVPYSPYAPGYYYGVGPMYYYGSPGYYDPRYPRYGVYSPYYYAPGMAAPYPYGVYNYPYPRYVVVPCVDSNHDGRCDRHPGQHDGEHPQNVPRTYVPPWTQPPPNVQPGVPPPPVIRPQQNPSVDAGPAHKKPRSGHRQGSRDDGLPRPQQP